MTSQANLKGLRVLVVEDEMMVSMLIEDMLSDLGCTVVGPASRLDEAIELANRAELDCAVLDVNLGGQPIFPLADLLREKGAPFSRSRSARGKIGCPPRFTSSTAQSSSARLANSIASSRREAGPTTVQPRSLSMSSMSMDTIISSSTTSTRSPFRFA